MRIGVILAVLVGLAVATAIIGYIGFGSVFSALSTIGWRSFVFFCVFSAIPYALLGTAWFVLVESVSLRNWGVLVWARLLREAASELLPFTQVGGFVIGARAAAIQGISATAALSTTVVDVTTELIAQLGFTGLGIAILVIHLNGRPVGEGLLAAASIGLGLTAIGAAGFILLQRHGMGFVEELARRFVPTAAAGAGDLKLAFVAIYRRRAALALSTGIHLIAWTTSATGAWLALRLAGLDIGLTNMLAIESLVFTIRTATFFAPMGIGVQEATYAFVGPIFGLGPELSLALSLIKRARELALGLPALLIWQGMEGRRLLVSARDAV